jgi:hypothetical protein
MFRETIWRNFHCETLFGGQKSRTKVNWGFDLKAKWLHKTRRNVREEDGCYVVDDEDDEERHVEGERDNERSVESMRRMCGFDELRERDDDEQSSKTDDWSR